ncbi:bifunctional UDP-sugar hydrolase/5'-nucleotidase [Carnobacteriaceae bacterium 52-44]
MKLTILATSDIHGYLFPTDYVDKSVESPLGLFKVASAIEKERIDSAGSLLLIDNGDFIQGSPLSQYINEQHHTPKHLISALNELNYDAGVIGNHEFNFGLDYLSESISRAKHPVLSANILTKEGKYLADGPAKIIEKDGLKIGILGLTTQYIPHWEHPQNIENLRFISAVETAKEWVPKLKKQADIIIVAYHGGFESDLFTGDPTERHTGENEGHRLLREVRGIDVLITGHQHREIAEVINRVPVIQPGYRGENIGKVELKIKKVNEELKIIEQKAELISTKNFPADNKLMKKYHFLENEVQDWLDEVIGQTAGDMRINDPNRARIKEHPYVEFINRVQKHYGKADISCTALFSNIVRGYGKNITNRDVILNYPYPNTLAVIKINGKELKEALEKSADYFTINEKNEIVVNPKYYMPKPQPYNYDMYEGIEYILDISKPVGQRVVKLEFNGKSVQANDQFELVTNQYRAVGGGNYSMFEGKEFIREINQSMSDLLKEYIQNEKMIRVDVNNNFQVINGEIVE